MVILIVEDKELIRNNLGDMLEEEITDVEIMKAKDGQQAINIMNEKEIDLFFLDIHLPDMTGLDVAEEIRKIDKYYFSFIIFLTTYSEYLLEAFKKFHCYDYLIKPFKKEQVLSTVKLLKTQVVIQQPNNVRRPIYFDLKNTVISMYDTEIYFIEVNRRVHTVYTEHGVYNIPNMSVKKMVNLLSYDCFVQCHRSYIINASNLLKIVKNESGPWIVYYKGIKEHALVSKKYKAIVRECVKSRGVVI